MALVDEWIRGGEEEDETDQAKKNGDGREKAKDYVAEEEDEVVSSAPSSPLRAPYKPDEHRFNRDPAYDEAFHRVEAKYKEKTGFMSMSPRPFSCYSIKFLNFVITRNDLYIEKLSFI
jgi:hypothetical protein